MRGIAGTGTLEWFSAFDSFSKLSIHCILFCALVALRIEKDSWARERYTYCIHYFRVYGQGSAVHVRGGETCFSPAHTVHCHWLCTSAPCFWLVNGIFAPKRKDAHICVWLAVVGIVLACSKQWKWRERERCSDFALTSPVTHLAS